MYQRHFLARGKNHVEGVLLSSLLAVGIQSITFLYLLTIISKIST